MKITNKIAVFSCTVICSIAFTLVSNADIQQNKTKLTSDEQFISRAKASTIKYKLTEKPLECFIFEVMDKKFEGKTLVTAREIHNAKCGGDPGTLPRAFSVGFDEKTGEIWSDAHSMLGLMVKLGME